MNRFDMKNFLSKKDILLIVFYLSLLSVLSSLFYISSGLNLPYADAISRLNIARKVFDNLTPGVVQLGNVWLPLPQVLMLPFIWIDFMWRTGLAGSIMSSISFIVGGVYVYKSAKLISNSALASFFTLNIYALNINVLYLQTTAMSEVIFIALLAICIYYLLLFIKENHWKYLIPAGFFISCLTLTRYEGLPMLLFSSLMVFFYLLFKDRKFYLIEGKFIIFLVLASFGFFLWTIYLLLIFDDPFFWITYYAAPQKEKIGEMIVERYSQSKPFFAAVWQYFTSVSWMSGIIVVGISLLSIPLMLIDSLRKKYWYALPLLLPISICLMIVFSLQRNTPIVQPNLSLTNIFRGDTSMDTGFNIRYGLMIHSWLAILTVYIFRISKIKFIFFTIFLIQVLNYFFLPISLIYRIPQNIPEKPYKDLVNWMRLNYKGGPILISASGFEDQMFEMGFPYRYFIHEGTNKYWKESLDHPARYASYIILDFNRVSDRLAKDFYEKENWLLFYNLVYESNEKGKIYEIKSSPEIEIQGIPTFNQKLKKSEYEDEKRFNR